MTRLLGMSARVQKYMIQLSKIDKGINRLS
jgi:hypothetical protein